MVKTFGSSILISVVALVVAFLYGQWNAVAVVAILGILEVSLSFDNAVINAGVMEDMSPKWRRLFLTVGIIIAAFGMRLLFPLVIVWITAGISPWPAFQLALHPPTDGSPTYAHYVEQAGPEIGAFGGMFLLMLFLSFIGTQSDFWLTWLEKPIASITRLKLGHFHYGAPIVALLVLAGVGFGVAHPQDRTKVFIAGVLGIICYALLHAFSQKFSETNERAAGSRNANLIRFIYLEVIDASFSFDGVIGAFAITSDPILILLGLGFIGTIFVRSITVYLSNSGTLAKFRYLEHGAHWAIGVLAAILLYKIGGKEVEDIITGVVGVVFIVAAVISSRFSTKHAPALP